MEYCKGIFCISRNELVDGGIMTASNYKLLAHRNKLTVVRQGKGLGNYALISVDSLPDKYRDLVKERYPNEKETRLQEWIVSNYERDQRATAYYFSKEECGIELPGPTAEEYVTNASVLNTCIKLYDNARAYKRLMGERYDWEQMTSAIEILKVRFGHTLPTSSLRFRKKVNDYKREGYAALISAKFGNQGARKVDFKTERLILSIAVQENKPWAKDVLEYYNAFVTGELEIWDSETGALYDPADFTDREGNPKTLSEATVTRYLNKPSNRLLIEHRQLSYTAFMHETMPHMHRHHGEFSLSKVSFDDRDLPRKLKDTRLRPKAYYAYDVTSGCCIGYAYNRSKNADLVVEMFRNMFRLLDRNGWGCPAEVEVENHLMSQWRESFLKAGKVFRYVRFCAPMNSQEKHAEHRNGGKKRSIEHKNHFGIGRFFAKNPRYRTESTKVFDELNNTYVEKEYYSWDELIAEDMEDIRQYNNSLHENQKKYPGMTRWEVFKRNINPTLRPLDKQTLAYYIGERVSTTIRRNSYCRVKGADWWIDGTASLERLEPNNYKVEACYLTDDQDEIRDMFIYQDGRFICRLENPGTYCTARAEQTEEDERIFIEQRKRISEFNSYVEKRSINRVGMMDARGFKEAVVAAQGAPVAAPVTAQAEDDYENYEFDIGDIRARAAAAL